jgi:hypothetical protein
VPEQHLHPVPHAPAAASPPAAAHATHDSESERSGAASAQQFTGKPVTLNVEVPKDLRKEARRLAERTGIALDAVVTDALARHVRREI